MEELKNVLVIGERVEIADEIGTKGIVIDLDIITNEGGKEPRAKVYWAEDSTLDSLYLGKETWICEGNLVVSYSQENLIHRNHKQLT